MSMQNDIAKFKELLDSSRKSVVLTGAGVSTMSGIPDFRGTNGIFERDKMHGLAIEDILSIDCFRVHPEYFYELKLFVYDDTKYRPNIVHEKLSELERNGKIHGIYTQNIDRLHVRAGSQNVYELHGSAEHNHCMKCHRHFAFAEVKDEANAGMVPHCPACGGVIKPDIVFYGENLNEQILNFAWNEFSTADLCIVLGSSLVVNPAASLPLLTLRHNGKLVIVNAQPTQLDSCACLKFNDLKTVFEQL